MPGVWFDHAAADAAVNFFSWYIKFSQGPVAGQPFLLQPWQAWIFRQLFGWKMANGKRLYRRVFLWVPRGNGKTEMLAGLGLLSIVGLGFQGGETYTIASTEEQAMKMFKAAQNMLAMSPDLAPLIEPLKKSLYCANTDSVYIPLTARPQGKHGLRCSVLLGDEMHEWPDGDLYDFVQQSQIKWPEPIAFNISTAGKPDGFGFQLWDECEMICDGAIADPHALVIMYAADPKKDDLTDPAVWRRVNPNLGVSIDEENFRIEVETKLGKPSARPNLLRYNFNIWSAEEIDRAIRPEAWALNTTRTTDKTYWRDLEEELAGQECWGGLDLSAGGDLNALVYLFPPTADRPRWALLPRFWWPRDKVDEIKRRARIRVDDWEHDGAINVTPGNASDHKMIERQVYADMEKFRIAGLAIDAWNSHQIAMDLSESGVPVERIRCGLQTLGPAWKRFEKMVLDADFEHGSHPVLTWNAACVALKPPDDNDNTMPTKRKSAGKIDGIVSTLMAGALAFAEPEQQSYLATSPMMVLS